MLKLFICIFVEKNRDEDVQERYDSSTKCMNPVSTAAILGSSLFMVILGMPPVTKRLIAFALGENEILEFAAFTPENLKGSAISLVIGALVYLTVVRHLLYREGSYVNRWPEKLDLEEGLYRPALTRWIPRVLPTIASVFGEDKILTPVCTFSFNLLQKIAYCFSVSTDYLILEMRRTALREKRVRRAGVGQVSHLRMLREGTAEAVNPILRNFTFALLMTCLGILMILGVLLIAIVHITP
jgi:hydrogenase-4 component B